MVEASFLVPLEIHPFIVLGVNFTLHYLILPEISLSSLYFEMRCLSSLNIKTFVLFK